MAGTFQYTLGGDFNAATSGTMYNSYNVPAYNIYASPLSSLVYTDRPLFFGPGADFSESFSSYEQYLMDSGGYTVYAHQQNSESWRDSIRPDNAGIYVEWSGYQTVATFFGGNFGDILVGGEVNDRLTGRGGNDTLGGNGGDDVLNGGAGGDSLDGGSGTDTASYAGAGAGVDAWLERVDFNEGEASGDTYTSIENLIGSGFADYLVGNAFANTIEGGNGDDVLGGQDGDDMLLGQAGADELGGGSGTDTASYAGSAAGVSVRLGIGFGYTGTGSGGDAQGDTLGFIENLTGSDHGDTLTGNDNANLLTGGAGGDTLDGGAGSDTASYAGSSAGVTVSLDAGTGSGGDAAGDTLTGIENLTGSGLADTLTGNGNGNILDGGGGDDTLNALGGAATLIGGSGDDTYELAQFGGAPQETVVEAADEGTDTVLSAAFLTTLSANVENLTLTGNARQGTGNSLGNVLTGTDVFNNVLTGLGGNDILDGKSGADTMAGGDGSDRYSVDDAGDTVTELAGEGTDKVFASADFTLFAQVEKLNLTGSAIEGTGNGLGNALTGNAEDNVLSGLGGADRLDGGDGADDLTGGTGNDTYLVDNTSDTITEVDGEGRDTLYADVAGYVLADGVSVETLIARVSGALDGNELVNSLRAGNTGDSLSGHGGSDRLTGGVGDDVLSGGEGADVLIGGLGSDSFRFETTLGGADPISDFLPGTDKIGLSTALFGAGAPLSGVLDESLFEANATGRATDGDIRVVYNTRNGALWMDMDGNGDGAAVLLARLSGHPSLTASDFDVV